MPRIRIKDLPQKQKISREELRNVVGGTVFLSPFPFFGSVSGSGLGTEMKLLEGEMEELRNDKKMTTTAYEPSDPESSDS